MTPPSRTIVLSDPLTLVGRELLELLPRFPELAGAMRCVHTADDEEHQIADLAGRASLVPPLGGSADLADAAAVILAGDAVTTRTAHVVSFLADHPEVPVVDAGRLLPLSDLLAVASTVPSAPSGLIHLRVAHPALVAADAVVSALAALQPASVSVVAFDPVSELGGDAIETLAAQSLERLQGLEVESLLGGRVRAFNMVVDPEDQRLDEDLADLLPGLETTATRILGGCFHGHLAHLGVAFAEAVSYGEIETMLEESPLLRRMEGELALDATVGSNSVLVSAPVISRSDRRVGITCALDGLRVGGALTALELVAGLLGVPGGGFGAH
jgi:hypothetical protein